MSAEENVAAEILAEDSADPNVCIKCFVKGDEGRLTEHETVTDLPRESESKMDSIAPTVTATEETTRKRKASSSVPAEGSNVVKKLIVDGDEEVSKAESGETVPAVEGGKPVVKPNEPSVDGGEPTNQDGEIPVEDARAGEKEDSTVAKADAVIAMETDKKTTGDVPLTETGKEPEPATEKEMTKDEEPTKETETKPTAEPPTTTAAPEVAEPNTKVGTECVVDGKENEQVDKEEQSV